MFSFNMEQTDLLLGYCQYRYFNTLCLLDDTWLPVHNFSHSFYALCIYGLLTQSVMTLGLTRNTNNLCFMVAKMCRFHVYTLKVFSFYMESVAWRIVCKISLFSLQTFKIVFLWHIMKLKICYIKFSKCPVDIMYFDFSRAFDVVPHSFLIKKIRKMVLQEKY